MQLQYIFHGEENEPHPFHIKSDWEPPVQPSVALETFLEEVNYSLQVYTEFINAAAQNGLNSNAWKRGW